MAKRGSKGARRRAIIELLRRRDEWSLEELARRFEVSVMTIRRDVARMALDGLVARTFGGCMLRRPLAVEAPATEKRQRQQQQKQVIARRVVAMLKPEQRVYLDTGTTVEEVARQLPGDFAAQFLTGNLAAAMVLFGRDAGEVLVCGGRLGRQSPELTGELALEQVRRFRLDLAIVGADGVDPATGEIYAADLPSAMLSRTARERAAAVIVAVDSSKFGTFGSVVSGTLEPGVTVVTDAGAAAGIVAQLRRHGCEVVIAAANTASGNDVSGQETNDDHDDNNGER